MNVALPLAPKTVDDAPEPNAAPASAPSLAPLPLHLREVRLVRRPHRRRGQKRGLEELLRDVLALRHRNRVGLDRALAAVLGHNLLLHRRASIVEQLVARLAGVEPLAAWEAEL